MKKTNGSIYRYIIALSLLCCTYTIKAQNVVEKDIQISVVDVVGYDEKDVDAEQLHVTDKDDTLDKPFMVVEQMPEYKDGQVAMMKYIAANLTFPPVAKENAIQGRIIARFVVNKDGKIRDVEIIRGLHPSCDEEAVRVIQNMPDWIPGKQNGQNVSVYFTLPIIFKIQEENVDSVDQKEGKSNN